VIVGLAGFGGGRDLVGKVEIFTKDEAKVTSRMRDI